MSLYDYKTPIGIPVIARDAPKRVTPPLANLEATLAAMKADAATWKRRKGKAWGEAIDLPNERLSSYTRIVWTEDRKTRLRAEILAELARHGESTLTAILHAVRDCNRHRLGETLTEMKAEGLVTWRQIKKTKLWGLA
jgi:hypothetical protein